jgi:hypothetical protein
LHHLGELVNQEVNEAQYQSLYRQVYFMPLAAFVKACKAYTYGPNARFPSDMLARLRTLTHEYAGDYSDIGGPGHISVRPTPEQLAEDAQLRLEMKQARPLQGAVKRLTARQLAEKFAVPPDVQQRMEQSQQKQIAGLLELKAAKGEA